MNGGFLIRFFRMASVVMLLVAAALLSAITTMHFAIHGAEVKIPALKGMTVAEARSQAAGMGLNLDVDNRYYSADVAAGHILSQSPAPGSVVRREWHVRVAESLGPQKVDVPDTVGTDARVAALRLRRAGLEVGVTAKLPFAGAEDGTVLAQDPPAHSQGIAQPSVNILVAAPENAAPDGYVMPDLSGVPVITAQAILNKIGLKVDTPTYADVSVSAVGTGAQPPKAPIVPGSVIAQQPMAGARVDQTTLIKLTAAK
jgi:beta-lactam-binding protein with PASTA domain